jgi:hypothetical protein
VGLVKPLEDGDNGTPRTVLAEGDLESKSVARRYWPGRPGVALVYMPRADIGDVGCGRAGERAAIPEEALLSGNRISTCAQSWCCVLLKPGEGIHLHGAQTWLNIRHGK